MNSNFHLNVVIVAKQNRMRWLDLCLGFFPPKGYAILLLKKGCSRLDDWSAIPAHIYRIEANPLLVAGQGDLQGFLGDIKPWQSSDLTNNGWAGLAVCMTGCISLLSRLRCCLTLVLGRSSLCFRHWRWSFNVSGSTVWHGSWPVSLWLNCWAVSQRSSSILKVKLSQLLNQRQASWRAFRISPAYMCFQAGYGWPGLEWPRLTTIPCSAWMGQLTNHRANNQHKTAAPWGKHPWRVLVLFLMTLPAPL